MSQRATWRSVAGRAAVVALLAVTPAVVDATPAGAWTDGECPTADGVTVVVDFQDLGGGVHVRCAPGAPATGFAALDAAGIAYQTTIRFPGFLCRIAGKPSNDPCVDTSPATAYWSYWVAARGGRWCYSNWGAASRTPPPGSVEGWSFSANRSTSTSPTPRYAVPAPIPGAAPLSADDCDPRADAPGAAPTAPPPPAPPPTTRPTPTAPATTPATTPGAATPPGAAVGAATTVPGAPTPGPDDRLADPSTVDGVVDGADAATDAGTDANATTATDEPTAAGSAHRSGNDRATASRGTVDLSDDGVDVGSSGGVLVAVGVVALLGAGTAAVARRRGRTA